MIALGETVVDEVVAAVTVETVALVESSDGAGFEITTDRILS